MTEPVTINIPREGYDRLQRENWSRLKYLLSSPALYHHRMLNPEEDTDPKRVGRASHVAALEPERFAAQHVKWTEGRRAGKKWDAFEAKWQGVAEILTEAEWDLCIAIQKAVRGNPRALQLITNGASEVTVCWTDKRTGIDCKARLDYASPLAVTDLKTTKCASQDSFGREAAKYGYHIQAAFYSDGYYAATGKRPPSYLIAVEKTEPHIVQVFRVPDEALEIGREEYGRLLDSLKFCRENNDWPGYGGSAPEMDLMLPRWITEAGDEDVGDLDLVIGDGA